MRDDTMHMKREEEGSVMGQSALGAFVSRYSKQLFWSLVIVLVAVTYVFSQKLESRPLQGAAVFSPQSGAYQVTLVSTIADPSFLAIRAGESVEFVVGDASRHNISERRSSMNRGDARIESGEFGEGESYLLHFNAPGEYHFYDRLNQDISVTIEVRD